MKYYLIIFVNIHVAYSFAAYESWRDASPCKPGDWEIDNDTHTKKLKSHISSGSKQPSKFEQELISCVLECSKECEGDKNIRVVCGSDYNNYYNLAQIKCAGSCGMYIKVLALSECPLDHTNLKPLSGDEFELCFSKCPSDQGHRPVCGTNNITYNNRDQLICALYCGVETRLEKALPC